MASREGIIGRIMALEFGVAVRGAITLMNLTAVQNMVLFCIILLTSAASVKGHGRIIVRKITEGTHLGLSTQVMVKGTLNNLNSPLSPLTDVILRVIQAACSSLVLSVHGWKILESSPFGVLLDPKIIDSRFLVYGIGKESSAYHCLDVFCNAGNSVVLVKYKDVYPIGPDPSWRSRCPKAFLMFPKMKMSIW